MSTCTASLGTESCSRQMCFRMLLSFWRDFVILNYIQATKRVRVRSYYDFFQSLTAAAPSESDSCSNACSHCSRLLQALLRTACDYAVYTPTDMRVQG